MTILMLQSSTDRQAKGIAFRRLSLVGGADARSEKWLQDLIYTNPALVPLDDIEAGAGELVSLKRELALPMAGRNVFLDVLGVSRSGRLVLIECKLWRNPQARREVIAQILEYASLLRGWTYGDLSVQVSAGSAAKNPIFELARKIWPDLDEARFVDGVSRSLAQGDFYLILAGDGMRSELHRISDHLNSSGLRAARFSMLEIQLWEDDAGRVLAIPHLPVTTKIIEHRVIVDRAGDLLPLSTDEEAEAEATERIINSDRAEAAARARPFWDQYIARAIFDHPDQPKPRHGGINWVKLIMPAPYRWITAFQEKEGALGFFIRFPDPSTVETYWALKDQAGRLRVESGLNLHFDDYENGTKAPTLYVMMPDVIDATETEKLDWLLDTGNRLVSLLRPLLAENAEGS